VVKIWGTVGLLSVLKEESFRSVADIVIELNQRIGNRIKDKVD
jgi:hypothetical protein